MHQGYGFLIVRNLQHTIKHLTACSAIFRRMISVAEFSHPAMSVVMFLTLFFKCIPLFLMLIRQYCFMSIIYTYHLNQHLKNLLQIFFIYLY